MGHTHLLDTIISYKAILVNRVQMMTKQHVLNDLLIVYALYVIIIKNHK